MRFDNIIIGSGQAGVPLAFRLSRAGQTVAIVEKDSFGGTCVNTGCTPTKTYVASARRAWAAQNSADLGVSAEAIKIDLKKIKSRKDDIVAESRDGIADGLAEDDNITVYRGHARFTDDKTITVNDETITADRVFVNVGARARTPEGFRREDYLTNRDLLELTEIPDHLIIIGGSYIGLEFGQLFRRFGSEVTIVEMHDRLVSKEDEDISEAVAGICRNSGIRLRLNAECLRAEREEDGKVTVHLDCTEPEKKVTGSHLLLAVGRVPNTDDLGLDQSSLQTDKRGYFEVSNQLETNVAGVYALGDCNGKGAFTHTAYNDFEIVADNLLDGADRKVSDRIMTYALYIDPPLGRVGLTETAARERGYNVKVASTPMSKVSRAREKGETQGLLKIIINADNDQVLGAAFLGTGGDELIHAIIDLMYTGQPYTVVANAVHVHPTVGEYLPTILQSV